MTHETLQDQTFNNIFIAGTTGKRFDITVRGGRFSSIVESNSPVARLDSSGSDLWISPGVIDLHTHLAWTDFDHDDQLKREALEVEVLQAQAFEATLRTGVTTARDAGALLPSVVKHIAQQYNQPLSVHTCGDMLGAGDARGSKHLEQRITDIIHSGASWIKILATGGLGAAPDAVLNPVFSEEEFAYIVRTAHAQGAKVLVHTWGGPTVDWSIDAGVESVEHGMYLTEAQAYRLAQSKTAFVPTASIYRIAADPSGVLGLPEVIRDRAARAAAAHPQAISYAKREGVRIGFGTDYATPALHGNNLDELDVLIDCGLTRDEAWQAATSSAAHILGYGDSLGRIQEGFTADAILFNADPYQSPSAKDLQRSIVSVIKGAVELDQ